MTFIQSVKTCFSKYVDFSGRAARSEFWYWVLFCIIASIIFNIIDMSVLHITDPDAFKPLSTIFSLITLLPSLAVSVRRLHDVDHSGWWWFIGLTIIGAIFPLLYWYCQMGTQGSNRFGPNPL